MRQD